MRVADLRGNPYQEAMNRGLLMIGAIVTVFIALVWGTCVAYRRIRSRSVINGIIRRNG
jgi:hypothetical protein